MLELFPFWEWCSRVITTPSYLLPKSWKSWLRSWERSATQPVARATKRERCCDAKRSRVLSFEMNLNFPWTFHHLNKGTAFSSRSIFVGISLFPSCVFLGRFNAGTGNLFAVVWEQRRASVSVGYHWFRLPRLTVSCRITSPPYIQMSPYSLWYDRTNISFSFVQ